MPNRQQRRAARAAATAAAGAAGAAATAAPASGGLAAKLAVVVGWLVIAGSCIRSLPQILRILKNKRCGTKLGRGHSQQLRQQVARS